MVLVIWINIVEVNNMFYKCRWKEQKQSNKFYMNFMVRNK